eukprot:5626_1
MCTKIRNSSFYLVRTIQQTLHMVQVIQHIQVHHIQIRHIKDIQIQPKFTHSNSGEAELNDGRDIKDLIWKEQNQFTPSQINGHIQYLLKQLVYHYIWQSWFTYKIMIHIIYEQELTKTEWNQIQHTWYKFAHSNPSFKINKRKRLQEIINIANNRRKHFNNLNMHQNMSVKHRNQQLL